VHVHARGDHAGVYGGIGIGVGSIAASSIAASSIAASISVGSGCCLFLSLLLVPSTAVGGAIAALALAPALAAVLSLLF
jgi:hypothetical protein